MINKKKKKIQFWLEEAWNSGNYILGKDIHIDEIISCEKKHWISESFKVFNEIEKEKTFLKIDLYLVLGVVLRYRRIPYDKIKMSEDTIINELDDSRPPSFYLMDDDSMKWIWDKSKKVQSIFNEKLFECYCREYNDQSDPREINRCLFFYLKMAKKG